MEYLKAFLIGGGVIGGAKWASTFMNPFYGSIVGGMPTGIISSFFLTGRAAVSDFYRAYAYHAVVLALTINIIRYVIDNYPKYDVRMVSAAGLVAWAAISLVIAFFMSK